MFAEYIWIDGTKPTANLRSKTKIFKPDGMFPTPQGLTTKLVLSSFPDWSFDGSSTEQAPGKDSDCVLKPVFFCIDPIRGDGNYLVMCEVFNVDGTPHISNTRAKLRGTIGTPLDDPKIPGPDSTAGEMLNCWFGLEQEYTLFKNERPLGFPLTGFPAGQGPYYCSVGAGTISGRPLVEAHAEACDSIGLKISGINAEVMPGQWEFQIGPAGPLEAGDHLWVARWLLARLGEDYGIDVSLDAKPVQGDWNGAGCHANFSTPLMRKNVTATQAASGRPMGLAAIEKFCEAAREYRVQHLAVYGHGYQDRLTGDHETCSFEDFKWGVSDRTASIRIPLATNQAGSGYLEDRRPNANIDPYQVAEVMLKTAYNLW